jgi:hypothetical protein
MNIEYELIKLIMIIIIIIIILLIVEYGCFVLIVVVLNDAKDNR